MTKFGYPTSVSNTPRYGTGTSQLPVPKFGVQTSTSKDKYVPTPRKADKEKKWLLKGWDTDRIADDGIVGWVKRRTVLESKQGSKKRPALDTDHYIPVKNKCSAIEDSGLFIQQSLHSTFHPKEQKSTMKNDNRNAVALRYTNTARIAANDVVGVITPVGYRERIETQQENNDPARETIDSYRQAKNDGSLPERRSRSVPESHPKHVYDKENQKLTTYHKIKRLLKFSNKDRRQRRFDEDDEGYSSKTSSAETKAGLGQESDSEDETEGGQSKHDKNRMYSSMIDLSDLPSNAVGREKNDIKEIESARVKFSYTHQPAILQLPDPHVELVHDRVRLEKRIENEDTDWSIAKLKRSKELNRSCQLPLEQPNHHEDTVYSLDTMKPVTLILRKISIQNSDENLTSIMPPSTWNNQSKEIASGTNSQRHNSDRATGSRVTSAVTRAELFTPRAVSAISRSSSSMSQNNSHHRLQNRPKSHHSRNNNREYNDPNNKSSKEPMWSQQYSVIERQATSYCIGDLLPAVDKNIYTNPYAKGKLGPPPSMNHHDNTMPDLMSTNVSYEDDGYMLLKKGMDLLTSGIEKHDAHVPGSNAITVLDTKTNSNIKRMLNQRETTHISHNSTEPTLGPPAFRPNQTRHPLIRNVTVIVNNKRHNHANSASPVHGGLSKGKSTTPIRVSSDKGPRPKHQTSEDKQTQRKLKEAFTKFYQNRPKDVGKEFRRMQTMWNT